MGRCGSYGPTIDVRCPQCGAEPGDPCRWISGEGSPETAPGVERPDLHFYRTRLPERPAMTDPAPLTDTETTHWEKTASAYGYLLAEDALPLIADLRAARAEVERVRAENAALDERVDALREQVGTLTRERDEWEANEQEQAREVERLALQLATMTADRDSWRRMAEIARLRNESLEHRLAP